MPTLSVHKARTHLQDYIFTDKRIVIGRGADAQVQLESEAVSRHHVLIRHHPRGWIVEDTSSNGLFINGKPVEKKALRDGDRIEFAHYVVIWSSLPAATSISSDSPFEARPEGPISNKQARLPTSLMPAAAGGASFAAQVQAAAAAAASPEPAGGSLYDLDTGDGPAAQEPSAAPVGGPMPHPGVPAPRVREDKATAFLSHDEMRNLRDRVARRRGAHLAFLNNAAGRKEFELVETEHFIGWSEDCDIPLPGRKILFKGAAWITQLANGKHRIDADNFLRKVEVSRKRVKSHILRDGEVIRVGGVEMRYHSAIDENG